MRFSLSALQFGKELLEVKSKAEEKQFGRDIGSPSHEKTPEVPVAFQHTKGTLYLNRAIHPQKCPSLRKKILKCGLSVFSRFYTHPDLFIFYLVGGLEALASEFAAGAIFAAVIVRGGNKSVFLFGTGTSKEELSPPCTEKTVLVLQRLHILDPPELRLEFLCLLLFVRDRLNKAVLTMLFQIQVIADAFVSGICHNVMVAFALHPLDVIQERNQRTGIRAVGKAATPVMYSLLTASWTL